MVLWEMVHVFGQCSEKWCMSLGSALRDGACEKFRWSPWLSLTIGVNRQTAMCVLSVCMLSFVSLIIGSFIRRKVISYQIVNLSLLKNDKKQKLLLNDKFLSFSFIIGMLFLSFLNYYFTFFQRGTVANPDVHILISNFSKLWKIYYEV